MKPLYLFYLILIVLSCKSQKPDVEKVIPEGYNAGIMYFEDDTNCMYQIKNTISNDIFDVVNVDAVLERFEWKDNQRIFFKFHRLRQSNRCENILPIEVEDIIIN